MCADEQTNAVLLGRIGPCIQALVPYVHDLKKIVTSRKRFAFEIFIYFQSETGMTVHQQELPCSTPPSRTLQAR